jgi:hypothetical protein
VKESISVLGYTVLCVNFGCSHFDLTNESLEVKLGTTLLYDASCWSTECT